MNPRIPLNFLFNVLFWYLLSLMGKICLHPSHYKSKMVRHNVITVYHLLALFMGGGVVEWLVEWQCQQKHIFHKKTCRFANAVGELSRKIAFWKHHPDKKKICISQKVLANPPNRSKTNVADLKRFLSWLELATSSLLPLFVSNWTLERIEPVWSDLTLLKRGLCNEFSCKRSTRVWRRLFGLFWKMSLFM